MKTFVIDNDNNITAYASAEACRTTEEACLVRNEGELEALAAGWPATRLAALWNTLPGVIAVKKFTDRRTAARRIWDAIQNLEATAEAPQSPEVPPLVQSTSKKDQVLALLHRPEGATLQEIMAAVAWQSHSVRGFLSGTVRKRMGLPLISSLRSGGQRAYRIDQAPASASLEGEGAR
jgi:hypothetical protein